MTRSALTIMLLLGAGLSGGCAGSRSEAPATLPASSIRPEYWLGYPASVTVSSPSFDRLWKAAESAARDFGFTPDRQDFRHGVLTTRPLISKQFFELWRNDVVDGSDLARSSLATYRRTIHFHFERDEDVYHVVPKVVIERYSFAEQQITSSAYVRSALTPRKTPPVGTAERDQGIYLPQRYWYAAGRDEALEKKLARAIDRKLNAR